MKGHVVDHKNHLGGMLTHFGQVLARVLQDMDPPIIHDSVPEFIDEATRGLFDLRVSSQHLLEAMNTLRREHGEVIPMIGDIVLKATVEF